MKDILQDIDDLLIKIDDGELEGADLYMAYLSTIYLTLSDARVEIQRLRRVNSDMGWRLNPDRMGGQFTEEEKNNTGWIR